MKVPQGRHRPAVLRAARRRHAQPARCRRRPLRRNQGDGATETHCAGTRASAATGGGVHSTRGGGDDRITLRRRGGPERARRLCNTVRAGIRHGARLVALGLVACRRTPAAISGRTAGQTTVARIQRVRTGLGLNYSAIGLVLDLLDHIEELESASRRGRTSRWTSTS